MPSADGTAIAVDGADVGAPSLRSVRLRLLAVGLGMGLLLVAIGAQLMRLALSGANELKFHTVEAVSRSANRPDILDRKGRLIATDLVGHSLFVDPGLVLDGDEMAEKLARTLPGLRREEIREHLRDRTKRFVWIRRGLTPQDAQRVHELGLPGLAFKREPKRAWPAGPLIGHVVGQVNPDNRGLAGVERHIDESGILERSALGGQGGLVPVRLSLDLGAQHSMQDELKGAVERYQAAGAAGLVMDARTGEIAAAVSFPPIDPAVPGAHLDPTRPDRLQGGVYELGSIFKAFTIAMSLDDDLATLEKTYDVSRPMVFGPHQIRDLHPLGRPLSVREIFVHSSNVGAAMLALEAGTTRQLVFLARMGLTEPMRTEAGPIAPPLLPQRWDAVETATIAFGHGIAIAPLQVAAAAAALINGGRRVKPTFLARDAELEPAPEQILQTKTSAALRELMRLNVTMAQGTGRRADVAGYRVGGKTGTAELPGKGGYQEKAVISTFLGALPMDEPRYVVLVALFEPKGGEGTGGGITAGLNAAPVTARVIERLAPILGVLPRRIEREP